MNGAGLRDHSALAQAVDRPVPKAFRRGTHRILSPAETLARVRPLMARMGITRLGNVTGLDRIGIPVWVAVRPNSRSVSVSQGKGLDREQAMASALMEACEGFHAEEVGAFRVCAYRELPAEHTVDPAQLCAAGKPFEPAVEIGWIEGWDLLCREPRWLPAEIVHTDYTRPPDGHFLAGSNGLASGNHLLEAISAAICELVERDAVALWNARGMPEKARRALDTASIDDLACRDLLARYEKAGIDVRLWDVTSDIGIAAFLCDIRDPAGGDPARLRRAYGAGCHPDRSVALARALTEAAQTRLTYITGIRDDLVPEQYADPPDVEIVDALLDALRREGEPVSFRDAPDWAADDLREDVLAELSRLRAAGIERVVAVDLTRPDFGVPVARVVIPGLEYDINHPAYIPGPRAHGTAGVLLSPSAHAHPIALSAPGGGEGRGEVRGATAPESTRNPHPSLPREQGRGHFRSLPREQGRGHFRSLPRERGRVDFRRLPRKRGRVGEGAGSLPLRGEDGKLAAHPPGLSRSSHTDMKAIIFAGPSLLPRLRPADPRLDWRPPARQGDVYRAALERPAIIGLIDGYFEVVPSVWHKEILWAMAKGIHVYGAASTGALRAAELAPFGMKGVGKIFEAFRDGTLEDDEEVAILHGPAELGYPALTEAMVNLRATLDHAVAQRLLDAALAAKATGAAKRLFYKDRNADAIVSAAAGSGASAASLGSLAQLLRIGKIDQKTRDALAMLDALRAHLDAGVSRLATSYRFASTAAWKSAARGAP